jgi:hypothetical protein
MRTRCEILSNSGPGPGDRPGSALGPMKEWPAVPGDSAPTHIDWREWTKRIQQETDPQKVVALARQLFDDYEKRRKSLSPEAE